MDNRTRAIQGALVSGETEICEQINIAQAPPSVLAKHIGKVYRVSANSTTTAVDDVSFFTNKGDCFALLGTSGAGKTTIFKILTQDVPPSQGEIYMGGKDLATKFPEIRRKIGYAPQYESCYFQMTVRENLEFYAKIKGIRSDLRENLIMKLIHEMRLEEYEHVLAGDLSGGNKRKLTVSLAIIGNPSIVFLDEPSTGVDPQAKRFMWKVIQKISVKNKNTSVILTTHSMEEAEALCTKMAIMVAGNFCCIGTPIELKEKFGKGFEIQISIPYPSEKEELEFINNLNSKAGLDLTLDSLLSREKVLALFNVSPRPDLASQLTKEGLASHMQTELDLGRQIKARILASFILVETRGREFAYELAREYNEVRVPEHMSNFYKFRVDKSKPYHTIGHLFGLMQDLTEKYGIINYSASQTSLSQIFQTFAKQAEVFFILD